jgi:NitT/TauT family transport system permease protein
MSLINYLGKKDLGIARGSLLTDVLLLVVVLGGLALLANAASGMWGAYEIGDPILIDLNPRCLPYYAARTVLRMFIGLFFSFVCAFTFGSMAAKNPVAEKIIIPLIDVLQSIPVIGFLEVSFVWFVYGFKGSFLGPEFASIFAVFVSQVWNLILSYYQSLKMMPKDLDEVAKIYRLSSWQRFFRLEVPFAAPGLIWNAMLSLSAGWFFVVAGEAITIANHNVSLPGIGSYIAEATNQGNYHAIYWAILCIFIVIMLYDQLLFRPLSFWIDAKNNPEAYIKPNWVWHVVSQSNLVHWIGRQLKSFSLCFPKRRAKKVRYFSSPGYLFSLLSLCLLTGCIGFLAYHSYGVISMPYGEVKVAFILGAYTATRVFVLVSLCCIIWFPVGIFLGLNPKIADILQPIIQFMAAFPPNMLYPLIGSYIIVHGYNPNIWLSPLIIMGTQWYILFNIIAGVRSLPPELLLMAKSLNLSKWRYYVKVVVPGVYPSLLTGVITAVGGAWNTSIIAEAVEWNGQAIYAKGLGAYIMKASRQGNSDQVYLGVIVMCVYVFVINQIVWIPLYQQVEKKYRG